MEKGGKEKTFTVLGGKNIILGKEGGGGAKISIIWIIYTSVSCIMKVLCPVVLS